MWIAIMLLTQKLLLFNSVGYFPGELQWQIHSSDKKFILLIGGNRSGKSRTDAMETFWAANHPNKMIWNVAPTYDLADKVYREAYFRLSSFGWKFARDISNPPETMLSNQSIIQAKSIEKPKSIEGERVDLMTCDEIGFYNELIWKRLLMRLDAPGSRAILSGTPKGKGIFLRRLWSEKIKDPNWLCLKMPTDEVEYVDRAFIEMAEQELGGKDNPAYREQIKAEFVAYGKLVYPQFAQKNIIRPQDLPQFGKGWTFLIGVDIGYIHPCAAVFLAINRSDQVYQFAEYYYRYREQATNAQMIMAMAGELQKKYNIRFSTLIYSHERPELTKTFKRFTISPTLRVVQGPGDPEGRRELMRQLIPTQIFVTNDCPMTIFEYENHSHRENSEDVEKVNDDCLDAKGEALLQYFAPTLKIKRYLYG